MADLKLTTAGDLDISSGDYELIDGINAIAQDVKIRLRFFLGEWFLDTRIGVPYFTKILGQKPRENVVRSILRQAILTTPGVLEVSSMSIDFEGAPRRLDVAFTATTDEGPLTFDERLILTE